MYVNYFSIKLGENKWRENSKPILFFKKAVQFVYHHKDKMKEENVLDPIFININAKIPTKLLMSEFLHV